MRLRFGRAYVRVRQRLPRASLVRGAAPRTKAAEGAPPILLVGCHRSGTSLLRRIVDSHPHIACPPETLFLEPFGQVVGGDMAARGLAGMGVEVDDAARQLGTLADQWLSAYARHQGKTRWAEKTPQVVNQLPGVDALFDHRARFVLLCRDGLDVATSLGRAESRWSVVGHHGVRHADPYVAAVHYWCEQNQKILDFAGSAPDRCHWIRYEDLVHEPERVLRGVFAFLGEPWDPCVLDFNRQRHDGGVEDHYVVATWTFEDNTGRHRKLPPALQAELWDVARSTMLALGYEDRHYSRG